MLFSEIMSCDNYNISVQLHLSRFLQCVHVFRNVYQFVSVFHVSGNEVSNPFMYLHEFCIMLDLVTNSLAAIRMITVLKQYLALRNLPNKSLFRLNDDASWDLTSNREFSLKCHTFSDVFLRPARLPSFLS